MQKYVEEDLEDDGFGDEEIQFTREKLTSSRSSGKQRPLAQYVKPEPRVDTVTDLDEFRDLALEDVQEQDTIKFRRGPHRPGLGSAFESDPDITYQGGDAESGTLRRKLKSVPSQLESYIEFDEDFGFQGSGPLRRARPQEQAPELALSDSDRSAASRHSHTSSVSSIGSALTESLDDDDQFEFDEPITDLRARFQARELRAKIENSARDAHLTMRKHKLPTHLASANDEDDVTGLDWDAFDAQRGTINRNVVFGTLRPPVTTRARQSPTRLRPAQSYAQIPTAPKNFGGVPAEPTRRLLRPAQSMYDIAAVRARMNRFEAGGKEFAQALPVQTPFRQAKNETTLLHRPLAVYAEPDGPHRTYRKNNPKSTSQEDNTTGLHNRRRRKLGLIRNPVPAGGSPTRQEVNGMVFNPHTGFWEGNEAESSKFDTIHARSGMLIRNTDTAVPGSTGDMVFDQRNLCWMYKSGYDDADPFQDIDDLQTSVHPARASTASFTSTVGRRETSAVETFVITPSVQLHWRDTDARFMRKFGRWITNEEQPEAAAFDLYKMVH